MRPQATGTDQSLTVIKFLTYVGGAPLSKKIMATVETSPAPMAAVKFPCAHFVAVAAHTQYAQVIPVIRYTSVATEFGQSGKTLYLKTKIMNLIMPKFIELA